MRYALLSMLLLAGCATNVTEEAALLLIDQLNEYERAVAVKIEAEQTFYADLKRDLMDSARRQAKTEQRIGRLNRVTILTDQAALQDKGLQLSLLQSFLREENQHGLDSKTQLAKRRDGLERLHASNFELLEFRRNEIRNTRNHLLRVARKQSSRDQLQKFFRESAQKAIELNEQAAHQQKVTEG